MAKENFDRSKPHVNVGTIGHVQQVEGSAGLTIGSVESTNVGNPQESYLFTAEATASFVPQTTTVVIPIDNEFFFRLATGPAESIEFAIDVLPQTLTGTGDVDVTLGILQGEFYLARESASYDPPSITGTSADWATLRSPRSLSAADFTAADGGQGRPDFNQPFQFGYAFTSQSPTTSLDLDLYLDNMSVEITTIPEPTSLALAASLGVAYIWNRWRRDD